MQELQPFAARYPMSAPLGAPNGATSASGSRRVFSRSNASLFQRGAQSSDTNGNGNATFLTECSFGVAHDKLVAVITDVQPFEPYWEDLAAIDLSGKKIESVARLKEFLPKLDSLVMLGAFAVPLLLVLTSYMPETQMNSHILVVFRALSGHYPLPPMGKFPYRTRWIMALTSLHAF